MGREVKRVALDFSWPVDKVWEGYLNPHYAHCHKCPECDGTGESPAMRQLKNNWYGFLGGNFRPEDRGSKPFEASDPLIIELAQRNVTRSPEYYGTSEDAVAREAQRLATHYNQGWSHHLNDADVAALLEADRLCDFTHTFVRGEGWKKKDPAYVPTAEEVNRWSLSGMGHDSCNQWVVCKAEALRLGIEPYCSECHGEGAYWDSEQAKAASETWEATEPPQGDGYQIWETVSEGSPISPVFATPEELAQHMAGTKWGADKGTSYEKWLAFIVGPGWAPSLVMDSNGVRNGIDI